ncbi:MAG: nitrate/nitrite transporter [Candidatus Methylomirabilia bacterium]
MRSDAPPEDRHLARALASVCLLGWALATNYTNHASLFPVLMERLGFGPAQAGLLSTAFFVSLAMVSVPAGVLSDRLGPKRIGSLGLALTFLSNVGLGFARDFTDLLAIKLFGGVGAGMAFIAGVRYVTVVFPPSRIHRAQGLYGGCSHLGAGTSLYLVPLLYTLLDWRATFIWSSGPVAASLGLWMLLAPDRRMTLPTSRPGEAIRSGTIWLLGLVHTSTFGLSVLVGTWITTFLVRDLDLALVPAGWVGSGILVAGIIARPTGGILIERRWLLPTTMIRAALLTSALGLALLALPGRPLRAALAAIIAMGITMSIPYSAVMNTASAALPRSPGAAVGMVGGLALLMIAIGAPAVGALYTWTETFSFPFGLLGVFCLLIFWMAHRISPRAERSDPDA